MTKNLVLTLAQEHKRNGQGDFLYRIKEWKDFNETGDKYRLIKMIKVSACEENYRNFVKEFTEIFGVKLIKLDEESVFIQGKDFIMIVSLM